MRERKGGRICPYFEWNDVRCARRFTLQRLSEVFDHCLGEFDTCKVFHQISISIQGKGETDVVARVR